MLKNDYVPYELCATVSNDTLESLHSYNGDGTEPADRKGISTGSDRGPVASWSEV